MPNLNRLKSRRARALCTVVAGCLAIILIFYWCGSPTNRTGSVEGRVAKLLNEQRRQDLENSAPMWVQ
jgi:hypothetical protein